MSWNDNQRPCLSCCCGTCLEHASILRYWLGYCSHLQASFENIPLYDVSVLTRHNCCGCVALLCPAPIAGALSDDARLTSDVSAWRLTSVSLSRTSGLSREQRCLGRLKIGTEVALVTRDSDTTFKVNLQGAGAYCGAQLVMIEDYTSKVPKRFSFEMFCQHEMSLLSSNMILIHSCCCVLYS